MQNTIALIFSQIQIAVFVDADRETEYTIVRFICAAVERSDDRYSTIRGIPE